MKRIAATIVHHKAYPGVLSTVSDLLNEGISPEAIVVIDNSEDPIICAQLRGALDERITLECVANGGYAQAANVGAARLRELGRWDGILILTHEVRIRAGAVQALSLRLEDPAVGAVGPLLIDGSRGDGTIWSAGGELTRRLLLPSHRSWGEPYRARPVGARDCDWLDGAMVLYRASVLTELRLPEMYFLYFEEVDYHAQLRRAGWRVVIEPAAVAEQTSSGVPPRYLGRNLQLFQFRNNDWIGWLFAVPTRLARFGAKVVLGRATPGGFWALCAGWMEGWRLGCGARGSAAHRRAQAGVAR